MNDFTVILAFGLPPAELAKDLLASMQTPALATLLGHAQRHSTSRAGAFERLLPHERFLAARCYGQHSPALPATAFMRALGLARSTGCWFMLNPVHIHIARDHLILTDQRQLPLDAADSRALFEAAVPYFAEHGIEIVYGDACNWFARIDAWRELDCASLDAACGHNIDIWLPKQAASPIERQWRKLQNEIQMLWYAHPVNQAREERGLPPVNALWLWGGSDAAVSPAQTQAGFAHLLAPPAVAPALATPNQSCLHLLGSNENKASQASLQYLDALSAPALANDWGDWLQQIHALDTDCFSALLTRLQHGELGRLHLVLSDSQHLHQFSVSRWDLRKFWRKNSLQALVLPLPPQASPAPAPRSQDLS